MQLYLDSEMEEVAAQMKAAGTFGDDFDIFTFRGIFEQISPLMWDRDSMPVHKVKDIMVPVNGTELAVRIYWPRESDTPLPVLLFFHGGGYTSGSVNTSDAHSRFFCREADCIVLEKAYLPNPEARKDWRCSPLLAPDLSNLPPAFILSAQYDFLRPEVDAYVARLREAGVPVCYQVWPGVLHNFFSQCSQLEIARVAMRNAAAQLRKALHS
jgi:acetyl esterase/lipase